MILILKIIILVILQLGVKILCQNNFNLTVRKFLRKGVNLTKKGVN
jgi:hypothetical protein